jgi:phage shock protein A
MSVWGKLFTVIRGGATEAAEAVVDKQALRILDQQVRDAETSLARAQTDLASLMGRAKLTRDKVMELQQKHARDMAVIERAIDQGQDQLAKELADRIAILEGELEREQASLQQLTRKEDELKGAVVKIRQNIQAMKREIETVKVTESVQKAQEQIVSHGAGAASTLNNAAASLQRIKERQAARSAQFEAADKLAEIQSGGDLDRRLADAGLLEGPGSGASVLARLKAQRQGALPTASHAGALPPPVQQIAAPISEADKIAG